MAAKALTWIGVVLFILGILGFAGVFIDLRDQRNKAAETAREMRLSDTVEPVSVTDVVKFDKMKEGTQALAYAASAAVAAGLVCLVGSVILRASGPKRA